MAIPQFLRNSVRNLQQRYISFRAVVEGLPPITSTKIDAALLRRLIGKSDPVILEIGCNNGGHTQWFLRMFDNPRIYCFEPDPRAVQKFRARIGACANVHLFEIALSDRNGEVAFFQSSGRRPAKSGEHSTDWDKSGSIRKPKEHLNQYKWVKFSDVITVPTMTLDDWCAAQGIEEIDFIWMDVQGAEMDVLRGGAQMLDHTRLIYTEYSNREMYEGQATLKGLLAHLTQFEALIRFPDDILLIHRDRGGG